jgi:light-regulated signal transduction histidine kinase (bacteriophytochrome)
MIAVVRDEVKRMGQLIDDILSFSRLSRSEMHVVNIDMASLARSVWDHLATEEQRARTDIHIAPLPSVTGDLALIRQVWTNLLSNAVKFSSGKPNASVWIDAKESKDEVTYVVRDNGAGFDMEYAGKLFGVFQRLHRQNEFEGTGVGLAIVQRIVHRHKGRVHAEGVLDEGATFSFTLPRKPTT